LAFGLTLGSELISAPAAADQNDPRLGDLFALLKAAPDPHVAQDVELSIWGIWVESDDDVIRLLMNQGLAAMARRDMRAALGKFDQIVKISPDFAEGWNKRATVHYLLGNYTASLHDIDETLALEPHHFGALSGRGLVFLELKERELALESFEAALEIHPQLPGANHNAQALRRQLEKNEI
jgi:tetratricopeptide (TPR) repeat protein